MSKCIESFPALVKVCYDTGMDNAFQQGSRNFNSCLALAEDFRKRYGLLGLDARHKAFVEKAFPDITDWRAPLNHMAEEVQEAIQSGEEEEFADILLLLLSSFRLRFPEGDVGYLLHIAHEKMAVNEKRKWGAKEAGGHRKHIKE